MNMPGKLAKNNFNIAKKIKRNRKMDFKYSF